jgi:hypothetical protein
LKQIQLVQPKNLIAGYIYYSRKGRIMRMNIIDEGAVLEILAGAQLPLNNIHERTLVNERGRVTRLRLAPCLGMDELPSVIQELLHLEELYLFWGGRNLTSLPAELFRLPNLKLIHIRQCQGLRRLLSDSDRSAKLSAVGNLDELIVEGCQNLTDLSCLMGLAPEPSTASSWPNLKRLHIVECPRANFGDAFLTGQKRPRQLQGQESFPSLLNLSLRKNRLTGADLGRLWCFFLSQCPRLVDVDLSDNQISSLRNLAQVAIATHDFATTGVDTNVPAFHSLRRLNLAGNPLLEKQDESRDADHERGRTHENQSHLIRLLHANPQLCSIFRCESDHHSSSPTARTGSSGRCFLASSLYSLKTQHALDLNHCSRGQKALQSDNARLPLAMWPLVLERAHATAAIPGMDATGTDVERFGLSSSYACRCRQAPIHIKQREASIIYTLLHGAVFASRGSYS